MSSEQPVEYWYRFEDVRYAPPADEYGEYRGRGELKVYLRKYVVIKHTPKGVWLERWETHTGKPRTVDEFNAPEKRFVRKDTNKRFACPTELEARESFLARKSKLIRIMKARITDAEEAMNIVEVAVCGLCGSYVQDRHRAIVTRNYRHLECVPL